MISGYLLLMMLISKHGINTYASPTPCIEKDYVYVHYGSPGTACIRTSDGAVVWKRTDLKCNHVQGPGASPVLYKNLLILHYEGTDVRFIVALDKSTGKEVWRTDRPAEPYKAMAQIGKKAYVTPLIINVKGRDLLISNGSAVCCAYDPLTGKEVWRVVGGAESTVPMPFAEKGTIYFYTGSVDSPEGGTYTDMLAVNPDGEGDITGTNILWKKRDDQFSYSNTYSGHKGRFDLYGYFKEFTYVHRCGNRKRNLVRANEVRP